MNLKKLVWIGTVSAVTAACSAGGEKVSYSLSSDFYSQYVWRGHNLVDDWVWQPSVGIAKGPWSAGIWGNLDLTDENDQSGEFTEYDFYGSYSWAVTENLMLSMGYIFYRFPSVGSTQELYWGLTVDAVLNPSLTVYYDFDDINGTYVSAGVSHSIEKIADLTESIPIGLTFSCSVGWGDSNYNKGYWTDAGGDPISSSAWNDLGIKVAFPIAFGTWTLTPSVHFVTVLDSEIRQGLSSSDRNLFFTGVSLSTAF